MTERMTAGEALREVHSGRGWAGPEWANLAAGPRLNWETRANTILSDAAAIRERMGEGWQDISTAPRQTTVMLYWPHWSHLPCFGSWQCHPTETRLRWVSDVCLSDDGVGPTHWMPLPEPPQ